MTYIIILFFIASFIATFLIVPTIAKIAMKFKIYDSSIDNVQNSKKVVLLGGVAIVLGFTFPFLVLSNIYLIVPIFAQSITAVLLIIFLNGIADDLLIFKPISKLFVQFIVCFVLVYICKLGFPVAQLENVYIQANILSIIINSLIIMICINAYNLIDGIDGLASTIAFISLFSYGIFFFLNQSYFYSAMAFSLSGAVFAFLLFNKSPAYIYMGDSGSLFIGLALAIFTLVFIGSSNNTVYFTNSSKLVIAFSFVGLPILDLIRLFFVRIYRRKNPLKGDKMHIHHLLIELGLTNNQVTFWLGIFHLSLIAIALSSNTYWFVFFLFAFILYVTFVQIIRQLITFKNKIERNYHSDSSSIRDIPYVDEKNIFSIHKTIFKKII